MWDELREKWLCNRFFACQEAVEAEVTRGLATPERNPEHVASLAGFAWITAIPLTVP